MSTGSTCGVRRISTRQYSSISGGAGACGGAGGGWARGAASCEQGGAPAHRRAMPEALVGRAAEKVEAFPARFPEDRLATD
jgi:hypothetical protein